MHQLAILEHKSLLLRWHMRVNFSLFDIIKIIRRGRYSLHHQQVERENGNNFSLVYYPFQKQTSGDYGIFFYQCWTDFQKLLLLPRLSNKMILNLACILFKYINNVGNLPLSRVELCDNWSENLSAAAHVG